MPRMYDDPYHHFELKADGTAFKCAHCDAEYPRVPNDGVHYDKRPAVYQVHQAESPDHKTTAVLQEKCSGKLSRIVV